MGAARAITANNNEQEKKIIAVLRHLNTKSADIEASAVMTKDGLNVASVLGDDVNPDRLSAMCASLLALADTTANELGRGTVKQLLLEGTKGIMLIVHIGKDAVLGVAARPKVNLGMVLFETRKTAKFISKSCYGNSE